ncbi:Ppx/GppA phosphatase family protein [Actinomycetospora corticicola]|uniref:Exopolyphosphatase/guanosine-5'-triphosphate, 3'-diphosphate pyrophosphatase n=1 Tax=Actinomycetospora corticicola TaxID=663602 RepID=A0A7Y9E1L0_9PSEU|nr:Ppx/GppA phosphatase family protein [Actinomycetospora corticicola]NYD39316.1 exopolyphosphatase/guanosine-5'-triphosphate,3'-diphosphate pyrophosphatase [Actinomycetospora corticicola]
MPRVAAIDCGTNSIRLLVADVTIREDGSQWLVDVHREMRVNRLGQGVDATHRIASESLARTKEALLAYGEMLRRTSTTTVRLCATSATRDAENRDEFFTMVREILGVDAEVITGEEEARLSFAGAVADLDPDEGPAVVADVGGGSTELVAGTWDAVAAEVAAAYSANVGCVRLTEKVLHDDPPSAAQVAEAEAFTRETLAPAFEAVDLADIQTWVAVAGTATTIAAVAMGLRSYAPEKIHLARLGLDEVRETCLRLESMPRSERAALGPMHPGRVDVIGGGSIVVRVLAEELAERAGVTELVVSEHDILDGIARECARASRAQ